MNTSPRYFIIRIFTCPIVGKLVTSYGRNMAAKSLHFLITVWYHRWRYITRSLAKQSTCEKPKFYIVIYTYSTVFDRFDPMKQV